MRGRRTGGPRAGRAFGRGLVTLALAAAATAHASPQPSAALDLFAGGGYDSNLFLLVAADPDSPTYRPYAGAFLRLAPGATLALSGESLRIELRAGADLRQTFGSGTLFMEDAQLALVRPEVGPFDLRVGLIGGRFDATVDPDLRFTSAGALAEAAWRLFDRWRFTAAYRLTGRWFGAPARIGVDRDLAHDAELRAAFSPRPTAQVAVSAGYLALGSTYDDPTVAATASGQFSRIWGGLDGAYVPAATVALSASVWAGSMRPDGAPSDLQIGGAAAASMGLGASVDAVLRYEGLVDRRGAGSPDPSGFQRHVISAGLLWRPRPSSRASSTPPAPSHDAPAISEGRVRFTLRAGDASSVAVVGSWNDWARVPAQVMRRTREPGLWEVVLPLPEGRHRYQFIRDGHALRPPAAPRYEDDGFGGQDGIIDVGDAP